MIADGWRALERFLLPNTCVVCSANVATREPDELVCPPCRTRLRPVLTGCARCQQPMPPVGPCRFCATWPQALGWVRSAVWLGPEARAIAHHLKYEGLGRLAALAATIVSRHVLQPESARLVPVPLSGRRQRVRGYNQAATIATALGHMWRLPVDDRLLRRVRAGPSQTGLTPEQRWTNVAGAFRVRASRDPRDRTSRIILVDDILTTGATMAASAAALEVGGWESVGGVTFARALPFEVRALIESSRCSDRPIAHSTTTLSRQA